MSSSSCAKNGSQDETRSIKLLLEFSSHDLEEAGNKCSVAETYAMSDIIRLSSSGSQDRLADIRFQYGNVGFDLTTFADVSHALLTELFAVPVYILFIREIGMWWT
ncbi:hypothetical protein RRG08_019529 [Elysia crispata]|uniref:Uncharacterized protein n=1 Tax=Elysia crispata TaxID=231223 RepID=A0AAE0YWU7_9GAST|nr:hypothetical protein RRG08_019529 [Elysia crispata]